LRRAISSSVNRSSSRIVGAIATSQRTVHAAEQPAQAERNGDDSIRLSFDGVAQGPLERAGAFARRLSRGIGNVRGVVARMAVKILDGIHRVAGNSARLFLDVAECADEIGTRGTGLWHDRSSLYRWVNAQNPQ
jgi:hypothetical protein